ncbi:MAG: prolipoprotein diacylglyceryl transferase [candidate division KSB1 bacterium]|nr:prolipoprotein diacylglyceryl transferase [candidate division KSB1 bacterium]
MHPVLFKLGPLQIHAYGLMLATSFVLGILLAARRAKKVGIDPNRIMDLGVVVAVSAIVGARLFYVVRHLDEFRGHWTDTFNPFQSTGQVGIGGLTLLGGVILALVTSYIYLRAKGLPFLRVADMVAPSLGLGIFLTRIGCFLNGCCYGVPTKLPWGVSFPEGCAAHWQYGSVPIHPTQLYSSLGGLIIFLALLALDRRRAFDGYLFYFFLIFYGLGRFLVDFVRYYEPSMVLMRLGSVAISYNQAISLLMLLAGALGLFLGARKSRVPQTS